MVVVQQASQKAGLIYADVGPGVCIRSQTTVGTTTPTFTLQMDHDRVQYVEVQKHSPKFDTNMATNCDDGEQCVMVM